MLHTIFASETVDSRPNQKRQVAQDGSTIGIELKAVAGWVLVIAVYSPFC